MLRHSTAILMVIASVLFFGFPAGAHKLSLYAGAAGAEISGKAYFAGGKPARGITISVKDSNGDILSRIITGPDGTFASRASKRMAHEFVADSGDGHVARFTVAAQDLPEDLPRKPATTAGPAMGQTEPASVKPHPGPTKEWIETAVARQMRPLREEMAVLRDQIRFRDILGGIGYIVGIAGILAWFHARRGQRSP
ncbi:MAG: hypothetical protein MI741_21815 [Rhodospirillales bacterium]|nr:hypothetical protein [Rhodospirillales bacterium]